MGRPRRQETFADAVARLAVERAAAPPRPVPNGFDGPDLVDPDGRRFSRVGDDATPAAARDLVAAGAALVWDSCGCAGSCGLDWVDAAEAARLAGSGPPRVGSRRRSGGLSAWRAEDGHLLLLAEGHVVWGDRLG